MNYQTVIDQFLTNSLKNIFKLYVREDENDWFYAVQSNNALVKLADEGKITKKCFIIKVFWK